MSSKVSIIVPCYNQAAYLKDALWSVINQIYQDWECIIVNDGSTDETETIAKHWIKADERIKLLSQENSGLSAARNNGIQKAEGKYILPLDADDRISPNYLKQAISEFERNKKIKLVYCRAEKFGEMNEEWVLPFFSLNRLKKSNIIFCSAVFKKVDWKKSGGYDENLKQGWEDWDFWISLLKDGGKVKRLNFVGFYYRVKSESMVRKMNEQIQNETFFYINKKHLDFFHKIYPDFKSLGRELSVSTSGNFLKRFKKLFK